jgi:hypothetical protein
MQIKFYNNSTIKLELKSKGLWCFSKMLVATLKKGVYKLTPSQTRTEVNVVWRKKLGRQKV